MITISTVPALLAKYLNFKNLTIEQYYDMIKKEELPDFSFFKNIEKAVARIKYALAQKEKIMIYGDYDADGIGATAIMLLTLYKLQGSNFNFYIPDREKDGYGLSKEKVSRFAEEKYQLIITVDNGVNAFEAIDEANNLGIDVIVVDHHQQSASLPGAYCIIHPLISNYTTTPMSAGFTTFALSSELLGYQDQYHKAIAALTTVSDVMPLIKENRALVIDGLEILNRHHFNSFLLLNNNSLLFTAGSLSSPIASSLNALARVGNEALLRNAVYLLISSSVEKQENFYSHVAGAIKLRKELMANALENMEQFSGKEIIVYYQKHLREGIIGLIATSLAKRYLVPSFVLTGEELLKGSVRVEGNFDLNQFFAQNADLFINSGGHKEAGGFTIAKDLLPELRHRLSNVKITPAQEELAIDINIDDINEEGVDALEKLGPFGAGNPDIIFKLRIGKRLLIVRGDHLFGSVGKFRLVGFNLAKDYARAEENVTIFISIGRSCFRGSEFIELRIKKII